MCELERYRSIRLEEDFIDLEKDEEKHGSAIGYNYGQPDSGLQPLPATEQTICLQEKPEPPSVSTLANIIEKTAEFIAKNGAQMEILMRTKEAGNLKFQFLKPDNPYHIIYQQVLEKKRQRKQNPYLYNQKISLQSELSIEEVEKSLRRLARNLPSSAPSSATSRGTYSSSNRNAEGCSYSKLVEKVHGNKVNNYP